MPESQQQSQCLAESFTRATGYGWKLDEYVVLLLPEVKWRDIAETILDIESDYLNK